MSINPGIRNESGNPRCPPWLRGGLGKGVGFTVIEFLGVLTIMAILAAVLLAPVIKKADRVAKETETEDLKVLVQGLKAHIIRNRNIPGETNWAQVIATELGRHVDTISTNSRRAPRVFLIDPALRIGTADGTLPYHQTLTGSIQPISPRLIILSSIFPTRELPVTSGIATNAAAFDNIWNAAEDTAPTNWPPEWEHHGEDLVIQRINLGSLFNRLIVNNFYHFDAALYSVDSQTTNQAPTNGIDAYFIDRTVLSFFDTNSLPEAAPSGAILERDLGPRKFLVDDQASALDASQIMERDTSLHYTLGTWLGDIIEGKRVTDLDVELAANLFLDAKENGNAKPDNQPTVQADVTGSMLEYLTNYVVWAQEGFPDHGNSYNRMLQAQDGLEDSSFDMVYKPALGKSPVHGHDGGKKGG